MVSYENLEMLLQSCDSKNSIRDIGDPRSQYKLKPNAPNDVKTLVRPTQLLLVSNLGYKVKFGTKLASRFDTKVKDTKKAGGSVKIFGIPIGLNADFNKSTEKTSHVGTWDNTSGEFTVKAIPDAGFATMLGVIGEKISTI